MHLLSISTLTSLVLPALFLLTPASAAQGPTPTSVPTCTTVYPTLGVPVDSAEPTRVYGNSTAVTLWNHPDIRSDRRTLFQFNLPRKGLTTCTLRFQAAAPPPMAFSGPVDVRAYLLASNVEALQSWSGKPKAKGTAGRARIALSRSATAPTEVTVAVGRCRGGTFNYELAMETVDGNLSFDRQPGNGFYMTYGC